MAQVEQVIPAAPEEVFAVLADGWTYSDWVVGTAHVSDVDPGYPSPGTRIHHKAGPWPLSVREEATVLECEAPYLLLLKVRVWPAGAGKVRLVLTPVGGNATRVTLTKDLVAGPLRRFRNRLGHPVLHRRNRETLRRLAELATNKARN